MFALQFRDIQQRSGKAFHITEKYFPELFTQSILLKDTIFDMFDIGIRTVKGLEFFSSKVDFALHVVLVSFNFCKSGAFTNIM